MRKEGAEDFELFLLMTSVLMESLVSIVCDVAVVASELCHDCAPSLTDVLEWGVYSIMLSVYLSAMEYMELSGLVNN